MNCVSIYCMINEDTKQFLVKYSLYDVKSSVYNTKIQEKGKLDKFECRIIETFNNSKSRIYLKWRVHELYQEYIEQGYTPYNAYKPLGWKLVIQVELGIPYNYGEQCRAIVKLKTSANYTFTVKVFNTMYEAKEFIQSNTVSSVIRLL